MVVVEDTHHSMEGEEGGLALEMDRLVCVIYMFSNRFNDGSNNFNTRATINTIPVHQEAIHLATTHPSENNLSSF